MRDAITRKFPFPYQAMMAICSDLDETPNKQTYFETMEFLNTTGMTSMGAGVGLEVGNTIYFDMPQNQFSYWNTDADGREMIHRLIRSGHIDCLHSYGDYATTRMHTMRALEELARNNCKLEVWVDHGVAPSNFGGDIMRGRGDIEGAEVYHADITCDFGIRYVWRGRVTSIIGQDSTKNYHGIWNNKYPFPSIKTISKEFIKSCLARFGDSRYSMHGPNKILRKTRLRSGQEVFEFIRSNPHWGGVSCGDTADGLAEVLSAPFLDTFCRREGFTILYTHLGKFKKGPFPFNPSTIESLRRVSDYCRSGKILVTTTRRLLNYCQTSEDIKLSISQSNGVTNIAVSFTEPTSDLSGMTFYVENPEQVQLMINGNFATNYKCNAADNTGRRSISIPWEPLKFPAF